MSTPSDRTADEDLPTLRETVPPWREWLRTYVIGLCMGTADAVPGVSGGTIALIAGIYERLIAAITAVTPDRALALLGALSPHDGGVSIAGAAAVLDEVDAWFLLALLGGVGTAVIVVTRIVHYADTHYPALLFGFFFGLIGASAVILLREVSVGTAGSGFAAVAGFLAAFVLSGQDTILGGGGLLVVFVAGLVAVSAMILPGISGSLLLVILGQYTRMSAALSTFVSELADLVSGGTVAALSDSGAIVATFLVGGLAGLFTVSRLVRRALDRNREATLAFLVALVVGALRAPIYEIRTRPDLVATTDVWLAFAVAAVVGGVFVLVLDWYAVDLDLDAA